MKLRSGPFEGAGGFVISFSTCGGSEPSRSRKPFGKKSMKTAVRGGLALWKDRARLQGVVYCESVHKDYPLVKLTGGYGDVAQMDARLVATHGRVNQKPDKQVRFLPSPEPQGAQSDPDFIRDGQSPSGEITWRSPLPKALRFVFPVALENIGANYE